MSEAAKFAIYGLPFTKAKDGLEVYHAGRLVEWIDTMRISVIDRRLMVSGVCREDYWDWTDPAMREIPFDLNVVNDRGDFIARSCTVALKAFDGHTLTLEMECKEWGWSFLCD